jgi:hypothetical protein
MTKRCSVILVSLLLAPLVLSAADIVAFPSGELTLHGVLFETVLGAERGNYCAAIDSAGAAQSWAEAPELRSLMTRAARNSNAPIFFFQAANDYDLSPSKTLSAAMKDAGKTYEVKIYPAYAGELRGAPTKCAHHSDRLNRTARRTSAAVFTFGTDPLGVSAAFAGSDRQAPKGAAAASSGQRRRWRWWFSHARSASCRSGCGTDRR